MRLIFIHLILSFTLLPVSAYSSSGDSFTSSYLGQENREIKSLSETDIEELKSGQGWGLAKAAELNGFPGPAHVLEMKEEIGLNPEQTKEIVTLFQEMQEQAISLGIKLIAYERALNTHFANKTITNELLQEIIEQIAQVSKQLRYTHLSTHLKTLEILTAEQVRLYNQLRGYFSDDPCKNIPAGHDPEMWKRHNNCP